MDEAFFYYRSDLNPSWDLFVQQGNDEVNNDLVEMVCGPEQDEENKNCTLLRNLGNTSQINVILSDNDIGEILNRVKFMILRTTG